MAATLDLNAEIDRDLDMLLGAVEEDLVWAATEWETLPDLERVDFALEWDHLMADYLTQLDDYARVGLLTDEQCARFETLRTLLREKMPLIERLDLYRPPVRLPP